MQKLANIKLLEEMNLKQSVRWEVEMGQWRRGWGCINSTFSRRGTTKVYWG